MISCSSSIIIPIHISSSPVTSLIMLSIVLPLIKFLAIIVLEIRTLHFWSWIKWRVKRPFFSFEFVFLNIFHDLLKLLLYDRNVHQFFLKGFFYLSKLRKAVIFRILGFLFYLIFLITLYFNLSWLRLVLLLNCYLRKCCVSYI